MFTLREHYCTVNSGVNRIVHKILMFTFSEQLKIMNARQWHILFLFPQEMPKYICVLTMGKYFNETEMWRNEADCIANCRQFGSNRRATDFTATTRVHAVSQRQICTQHSQHQTGQHIYRHMLACGQGGIDDADAPRPIEDEHPQRCAKATQQVV
jgi:Uri superfamily endonuclease